MKKLKHMFPALLMLALLIVAQAFLGYYKENASETALEAETVASHEAVFDEETQEYDEEEIVEIPEKEERGESSQSEKSAKLYWGNKSTLDDHFQRHGGDFDAETPEEYALMAHELYENRDDYQVKVDSEGNGDIRVYDDETGAFGAYNKNGTTKTFFKPSAGQAYFDRQPGRLE